MLKFSVVVVSVVALVDVVEVGIKSCVESMLNFSVFVSLRVAVGGVVVGGVGATVGSISVGW